MTEEEQYIKAQSECGIKVGDWVIPWAVAKSNSSGWDNNWDDDMDRMIGQKFCVCWINKTGIALNADVEYEFPYFSLRKVYEEDKPEVTYEELCKDLNTFDKVLVRDDDCDHWGIDFYSHYHELDKFVCSTNCEWGQCIPYVGNEIYLNTSKNPLKSEDE